MLVRAAAQCEQEHFMAHIVAICSFPFCIFNVDIDLTIRVIKVKTNVHCGTEEVNPRSPVPSQRIHFCSFMLKQIKEWLMLPF